jgi:tRNA A-37 threonylcarbamoyl transferase component Bud32
MTTSSPDAHPTPPPADGNQPADAEAPAGKFPHADDDFGLTSKAKADQQAKAQRVDPLLGMDLGGVKIVRLLGEGGMGRVYEALQQNPSRTVAVKVIRAGITSEKTMRRFEREAQFLGKLQHPGIAQIFVVGSYSSDIGDVPFFVMEYIPHAKPITNYVAEQGLTLRDTLGLFKQVCEAVCHGHDRGIVHRDLKPGNILIDSDGMPKIIDFGVARSTDSDLTLTAMRTDTGALVGTVQYMSPEQFGDSSAEGLDGRADVYALGVVLYELLAGELPYQVRRKKMHEAARIVCEYIPPTLRSRDKSIPRAVSLIAERCLQKDRRGRYQSAGELVRDIQCVLDGKPIRMPAMGWLSLVRERLSSKYGRLGLLGLLAAACLGGVLLGRAGRSGSDVQPRKVAPPATGAADAGSARDSAKPPPQISGTWAEITSDGSPSERFRVFREDGVYIERYYGYEETGRWEALPNHAGLRIIKPGEKPVDGQFVNGELHVPRPGTASGLVLPPMVYRRDRAGAHEADGGLPEADKRPGNPQLPQ